MEKAKEKRKVYDYLSVSTNFFIRKKKQITDYSGKSNHESACMIRVRGFHLQCCVEIVCLYSSTRLSTVMRIDLTHFSSVEERVYVFFFFPFSRRFFRPQPGFSPLPTSATKRNRQEKKQERIVHVHHIYVTNVVLCEKHTLIRQKKRKIYP